MERGRWAGATAFLLSRAAAGAPSLDEPSKLNDMAPVTGAFTEGVAADVPSAVAADALGAVAADATGTVASAVPHAVCIAGAGA